MVKRLTKSSSVRRENTLCRVLGTRAQPHRACPGTGTAAAAAVAGAAVCSCPCKSTGCATCCQHSVSGGGGGCWRCSRCWCCCWGCYDGSNIIPQPMHFCAHTTKKWLMSCLITWRKSMSRIAKAVSQPASRWAKQPAGSTPLDHVVVRQVVCRRVGRQCISVAIASAHNKSIIFFKQTQISKRHRWFWSAGSDNLLLSHTTLRMATSHMPYAICMYVCVRSCVVSNLGTPQSTRWSSDWLRAPPLQQNPNPNQSDLSRTCDHASCLWLF